MANNVIKILVINSFPKAGNPHEVTTVETSFKLKKETEGNLMLFNLILLLSGTGNISFEKKRNKTKRGSPRRRW